MEFRIGDMSNGIQTSEQIIEADSYVRALEKTVEDANLYCEPQEEFDKDFLITSICKEDIIDKFTKEQVDSLDDGDMTHIASKMADAYCNSGFWIDMKIIVEQVLDDKK